MGDKYNSKQSDSKNKRVKTTKKESLPSILKKIDDNTKSKFKEIEKILNIKKDYSIKFDKINNNIKVYEEDVKIITATYDFYGIIKPNGQFYWSYMIPGSDRKFIKKIEHIKNLSYLFENSDHPDMLFYHMILTQDSILITEDQVNKLLSLLLYLGGNKYFLHSMNSSGNIQLIFLKDIIEKYV